MKRWLLALGLVWSGFAHSQTFVNGASVGEVSGPNVILVFPGPNAGVMQCVPANSDSCSPSVPGTTVTQNINYLLPTAHVWALVPPATTAAWVPLSTVELTPPVPVPGTGSVPVCYPKAPWLNETWGFLPAGISTTRDMYAAWVCNTPTGYQTFATVFLLTDVAKTVLQFTKGTWTAAQATADCTANCTAPTPLEWQFMQTIFPTARPQALVAFNGASLTRPVYGVNSTGNLVTTAVAGEAVAVAAPCDETSRIVTAPQYYSVGGQSNAASGATAVSVLPAGSYTI
jgi:hypothetical protein